jgi:hypothetical protein
VRITTTVTVTEVREHFRTIHIRGVGDDAVTAEKSLGWWVTFDNKLTLCLGHEQPPYRPGDKVKWTFE